MQILRVTKYFLEYKEFESENLGSSLAKEGILYLHLREFGGYRRPSYEDFTKSEEFIEEMN